MGIEKHLIMLESRRNKVKETSLCENPNGWKENKIIYGLRRSCCNQLRKKWLQYGQSNGEM